MKYCLPKGTITVYWSMEVETKNTERKKYNHVEIKGNLH